MVTQYQNMIGVLRWCVELGRLDINMEVALLSSYSAAPREGHLQAAYHIFAYLRKHLHSRNVFDHGLPYIDESQFTETTEKWKEFYGDVYEEIPPGQPEPRGNSVIITCFVDADHAGNLVTRRSHTGILIFLNKAPIIWYSKRQNTVEASTFGSEFNALRQAKEMIVITQ